MSTLFPDELLLQSEKLAAVSWAGNNIASRRVRPGHDNNTSVILIGGPHDCTVVYAPPRARVRVQSQFVSSRRGTEIFHHIYADAGRERWVFGESAFGGYAAREFEHFTTVVTEPRCANAVLANG